MTQIVNSMQASGTSQNAVRDFFLEELEMIASGTWPGLGGVRQVDRERIRRFYVAKGPRARCST